MRAGLTREFFDEQPPKPKQVKRLRKYVREQIAPVAENLLRYGTPDMTVGTSKTFRSLARICGAAPYSAGPHVKREMHLQDLRLWTRRMEAMTVQERGDLPGVSKTRGGADAGRALLRRRRRWRRLGLRRCVCARGRCVRA